MVLLRRSSVEISVSYLDYFKLLEYFLLNTKNHNISIKVYNDLYKSFAQLYGNLCGLTGSISSSPYSLEEEYCKDIIYSWNNINRSTIPYYTLANTIKDMYFDNSHRVYYLKKYLIGLCVALNEFHSMVHSKYTYYCNPDVLVIDRTQENTKYSLNMLMKNSLKLKKKMFEFHNLIVNYERRCV